MIHYLPGQLGHLLIVIAFVSALISCYGFFRASKLEDGTWDRFNTIALYVHSFAIIGVLFTLLLIINQKYFEYHYAWNYSSRILPIYYQISSFWHGQEGSFLLWMFWNVVLGLILFHTNKFWKSPVMTIMSLNQVFLTSMILGVVVFETKIGSSPFLLLRDVIQDNVFKINPDFVPKDGTGMNPLLQNYWMVIHPPTLFLGFASTVVPFAFALAGIWKGKYREWIRPALPWAQFSGLVLGVGILMGAYWAYETLNFGCYWNWDPVENAIYVPWLILIAAMHTMIAYRKNETALKSSLILVAATYLLILYSTFLTRSGILGESSVHSFTDLGLSGQLLIYLIVFLAGTAVLFSLKWKHLGSPSQEVSSYSREFWIFMGATTLCLMGFQVLIPTSIPVWNEILALFGINSNLAPPVDQIGFYTKFQIWFAILIALLSGTGQMFWWTKMSPADIKKAITVPVIISLLLSSIVFLFSGINDISMILLLTTSIYSVVANGKILWQLRKSKFKLTGGSVTHIGIALMLIGILFSSGQSKILSKNNTGLMWSREFPDDMNQDNLLLFLNEPRQMGDYSLTYIGSRKKVKKWGFIEADLLAKTTNPLEMVVKETLAVDGKGTLNKGDTVELTNPENSYFEVDYKIDESSFKLFPRIQINEQMGTLSSPDIKRTLRADLYTHISNLPDPDAEREWSEVEEIKVKVGDQFFINDYVASFLRMERVQEIDGISLEGDDVAVKAVIEIQTEQSPILVEPIYVIKNRMAGKLPDEIKSVAAKITIQSIQPEDDSFTFGISTTQKDWIILEAVEKPGINILWSGTLILIMGFFIAISRRYSEFQKSRDKGLE